MIDKIKLTILLWILSVENPIALFFLKPIYGIIAGHSYNEMLAKAKTITQFDVEVEATSMKAVKREKKRRPRMKVSGRALKNGRQIGIKK